uniref:Uncharacterized protein n=1 Tax=Amphimedon queenslandica TaxID=400682 RepID=A0A1X7UFS9_AMPQE
SSIISSVTSSFSQLKCLAKVSVISSLLFFGNVSLCPFKARAKLRSLTFSGSS